MTAPLDVYGKLAAATIAFYIPVAIVTTYLVIRHGFKRDAGWVFLWLFSLVRIAGGALLIAAEEIRPVNISLYTAAYILQSVGLSPLLLSTLGFLGLVGQHAFSENARMSRSFRLIGMFAIVALVLSIVGGVELSNNGKSSTGTALRKAGAIVFGVVYVCLVLVHIGCWGYRHAIMRHRRKLLIGVSLALPFLGVRVVYSILNAFSTSSPSLARFNSQTGDWVLYLVMSLIMEYCVVVIYSVSGTMIGLRKDHEHYHG